LSAEVYAFVQDVRLRLILLARWDQNQIIVLEKNPHYFKSGLPYLDRIELWVMIDFGEQFPYDPEKAKALLKEAGFDQKNPLRYAIITHGAEAALPTIATITKTQYTKLGVEVTVDVIDRPIFLRRLTRDRDWEQTVNLTGAALDPYTIARAIDTRAGNNTINHDDTQVDVLIDRMRMKETGTEEAFLQAGYDFQGYIAEHMMTTSVIALPFPQAARASVKGYEHLHGFKIRFETTWLDKP
jgi:ABC-type transport system substrate-binding protein